MPTEGPRTCVLGTRQEGFGPPGLPAALLWDQRSDWAVVVEAHSGENRVVQAWFCTDLSPLGRG